MPQHDQADQHQRLGPDRPQSERFGEFGEGADHRDQGVEQRGRGLLPGQQPVAARPGRQPQRADAADHREDDEGRPPDLRLLGAAGEQAHQGGQQERRVDPADDAPQGGVAHLVVVALDDVPPQPDQGGSRWRRRARGRC
ncbi:hypothetical protein [Streptomyces erythrochromogenes]|uniref:hypothetical protein n=1 Tax=Streptomyces erythrochromogenes TaxID=285574 RepID=UPI0027E29E40|nr:hypothetical protein [Streptomyces erythrochromogenes]